VLDHVILNVRDHDASRAFYEQVLAPLGAGVAMEFPGFTGFGRAGRPQFWIVQRDEPSANVHVAFSTRDRAVVDAFHEAALTAGGTDNGAPGAREQYHPMYYGAFVLDPDGNNIEVVCHLPPPDDGDYEPE
jgi:catechol 2,3-dioxygenase-like lactoylglutathione lyase family enzyme